MHDRIFPWNKFHKILNLKSQNLHHHSICALSNVLETGVSWTNRENLSPNIFGIILSSTWNITSCLLWLWRLLRSSIGWINCQILKKYNRWVIKMNLIILCNFTIFKFCENTWIQDVSMILHWLIESTVKYSKRVKVKTDGEKYTRNLLIYRNKIQNFPVKNYFQIFART